MSTDAWRIGEGAESARRRLSAFRTAALRFLFGDRIGLALFLGTLCFVGLYWRVGFFINDNYTIANGLVALADGRLAITEATFGSLNSPGTHLVDGNVYARNYGHIVVSVPVLWALDGLALVFDPGLLFSALWSLGALALSVTVGRVLGRRGPAALVGAGLALAAFLANLAAARPLDTAQFPLVALQVTSILAGALAVVTLYRLLARMHRRRVGVAVAAVTLAATPVGFWATVPKRHVFTVAATVGVMYALYRSRARQSSGLEPRSFRLLAYVIVGLYTWVHAAEGLILLVMLVAVDVPTAPTNDWRTLLAVGVALTASLIPFVVTNLLLSGDPLAPPRMLPDIGANVADLDMSSGSSGGAGGSGTGGSASRSKNGVVAVVTVLVAKALRVWGIFVGFYETGARTILSTPARLADVLIRGGYFAGVSGRDHNQTIYLTVVESAPIIAAGSVLIVGAVRRLQSALSGGTHGLRRCLAAARRSQSRAVDAFATLVCLSFVVVYIPMLPLHAQFTVRYLVPVFVLGVYAVGRQASIRRILDTDGRLALWAWVVGVCIGLQLLVLAVALANLGSGEALQIHAVLALTFGTFLALVAPIAAVTDHLQRVTAVTFGLAAALGTDLLLLSGPLYLQLGQYALPIVDELARLLSLV